MKGKPLVSSVIIFLNAEEFIREAIESVFAQTYNNWELFLVDDGSTDASTGIARRYAQQHPEKVRYLNHEGHQNRGMSASRNLGVNKTAGEYIGFLDADDVWLPHKLEQQVAILQSHREAAMVYGRSKIWYGWTGNPEDIHRDRFFDLGLDPDTLVEPPRLLILLLENLFQTPTTCNALLRREVFNKIGGFHEVFRGFYEDQVFFSKVCLNFPVFVSSECWAMYRQHPNSCSSAAKQAGDRHSRRLHFLNWLAGYLAEQQVKDERVWKTFQRELRACHYPRLYHPVKRFQRLAHKIMEQLQ